LWVASGLINSEQEHGDSEIKGFFEKKCDGGGGDIRQDISQDILKKKKKKEQGALSPR
jgi:hypothetical protein